MSKYKSGTKKYLKYVIEHIESNADTRISQSENRFQPCSLPCELENPLKLSMFSEPCPLMRAKGPGSAWLDVYGPRAPHLTIHPEVGFLRSWYRPFLWPPWVLRTLQNPQFTLLDFSTPHGLGLGSFIPFQQLPHSVAPHPLGCGLFLHPPTMPLLPTHAQEGHSPASRR